MPERHLRHYVLKLPDSPVLFSVPREGIRRHDPEALVYDVRAGTDAFLRHYSFYERWFEVNVAFDAAGCLIAESGPNGFLWAFNCDIDTPLVDVAPDAVARIDLKLDILVAADGRTHFLKDEDDFARSITAGWITPEEAKDAQHGLADLRSIMEGEGLIAFLNGIYPFPAPADLRSLPPQPPVAFPSVSDTPFADRVSHR